jgi:hypothetical protein
VKKVVFCNNQRYLRDSQELLATMQSMSASFCSSIGLLGACKIDPKTSMRSWPVDFYINKNYGYIKGEGWQRFCQDNDVEEGDTCTFKVVEKTVWLVVIE